MSESEQTSRFFIELASAALERTRGRGRLGEDPTGTVRTVALSGPSTLGGSEAQREDRVLATGIDTAVSGFRVIEKIGEGGMGVVFRAHQEDLDRDVAIKAMRGTSRGTDGRADFVAEAAVTGWLDHPNIVPVHALEGRAAVPFFAMKLVGGQPWGTLMRDDSVPLTRHLEILTAVCNAVAFAHSRGFLHRDLKPSNVMVGEFGEVLVMDWGLACRFGAADDGPSGHRRAVEIDYVEGTPVYMAPEMARGEGKLFGPWTDVYVLGAILYEILNGKPPHAGGKIEDVVARAAVAALPEFNDDAPVGLADICRRAMLREPEGRTRSARTFREELRAYGRHAESEKLARAARRWATEAATEQKDNVAYEKLQRAVSGYEQALVIWDENHAASHELQGAHRTFAERALAGGDLGMARNQALAMDDPGALIDEIDRASAHQGRLIRIAAFQKRVVAAALIVIIVSLSAAFVMVSGSRDEERAAKTRAEQARLEAEKEAAEARAVSTFLQGLFEASDPFLRSGDSFGLRVGTSADLTARDVLERGARQLMQNALENQPLVRADLLDTIGNVYLSLGFTDDAAPLLEESARVRAELLEPDHPDLLDSRMSANILASSRGEPCSDALRQTLAAQRAVLGEDALELVRGTFNLLVQLAMEWKLEELPATLAEFERLVDVHYPPDSRQKALALLCGAQARMILKENEQAVANVQEAALIIDALDGSDRFSTLIGQFIQAQVLERMGQKAAADSLWAAAFDEMAALAGEHHYMTAWASMRYFEFLYHARLDDEKTVRLGERCIELCSAVFGERSGLLPPRLERLASAYWRIDARDRAFEVIDRAEKIALAVGDTSVLAGILDQKAFQFSKERRFDEAETAYRRALDVCARNGHSQRSATRHLAQIFLWTQDEKSAWRSVFDRPESAAEYLARARAFLLAHELELEEAVSTDDQTAAQAFASNALLSLADARAAGLSPLADDDPLRLLEESHTIPDSFR